MVRPEDQRIVVHAPGFANAACRWVPLALAAGLGLGVPAAAIFSPGGPTAGRVSASGEASGTGLTMTADLPTGGPTGGMGYLGDARSNAPNGDPSASPDPPPSGISPTIAIPPGPIPPSFVVPTPLALPLAGISEPSGLDLLAPVALALLLRCSLRRSNNSIDRPNG